MHEPSRQGEAERDFRDALAIREKWLGPQHPLVAVSRKDLDELLKAEATAKLANPIR
jgi:hypothetical protein